MKKATGFCTILGVRFLQEGYPTAKRLLDGGALMVVPSGPGLATIHRDRLYYEALKNSDFALPDSGLMVLFIKYVRKKRIEKLSGLAFLRAFFEEPALREENRLFLVDPNEKESALNNRYLSSRNIRIDPSDHYIAPFYKADRVEDPDLVRLLDQKQPKYVLINIGGGIQEKLGWYLKQHLSYQPGIICTGAAIAFLTHKQVAIPSLFDRLHLGWLLRCAHEPGRFVPRYLKALAPVPILMREVR